VPPGPYGVEAGDQQGVRAIHGLGRLPLTLERVECTEEARGDGVGDVVIARDGEDRRAKRAQQLGCSLVLVGPAAMREVAAGDEQLRPMLLDEREESGRDRRIFRRAHVEIRDVEEAGRHDRRRL
jgi:hypothetical protein